MCAVSDATLLSVANYTLNDEAGRVERLEGIETKFYSLQKYDVIASAFVFAIEVVRGKTEVFSFILVLPYSEMSDYLARHSLCETRVQKLLQNYFINPLQDMVRETYCIILPVHWLSYLSPPCIHVYTLIWLVLHSYSLMCPSYFLSAKRHLFI